MGIRIIITGRGTRTRIDVVDFPETISISLLETLYERWESAGIGCGVVATHRCC
jgi:hypothetical protein